MLRLRYLALFLALAVPGAGGCGDDDSSSETDAGHSGSSHGNAGKGGNSAGSQSGEAGAGSSASGTGGKAGTAANGGRSGGGGTGGSAAGSGATGGTGGAASTGAGSGGTASDPSAELFDPDKLPRFDIDLPAASITALNADPDSYVTGTLHYNGETISSIGIRIKGEATKRSLDQKAAFKIKFDEFVDKQEFHGLRRLTLNNLVEDASFLAERLAFHMFRAGKLPAPRANSALVYVNGDYFGVYANIETEDKTFLRRWFTSDAGNLYEEGESDFEYAHEMLFDLETNEAKNDRSDLTKLFLALNDSTNPDTYLSDIDGSLDTAHFLRFSAMEAAVDQWDMYSYTFFYPNNFRIYDDPATGKFVFLPWGMDLSLKPFLYTNRPHISIFEISWYEDNPDHNAPTARESSGQMFRRCLESATCKATYTNVIRDTAKIFDDEKLDTLAEKYYDQIKSHVYEDERKEVSNADFEKAYQSLLTTIRTRTAAIRKDLGE
ncbi:MAG TPA: CotH kinase family protein [Polyangiales bacterium]|nr:CotH kinase family protein [Polyangiales bacterium]